MPMPNAANNINCQAIGWMVPIQRFGNGNCSAKSCFLKIFAIIIFSVVSLLVFRYWELVFIFQCLTACIIYFVILTAGRISLR